MVIATVLLSVIGMSVGLVLNRQDRDRGAADGGQQQQAGPAPAPTPAVEVTSTGKPCRPETQARGREYGATGVLTEVLQLRTRTSAVWICEDQGGQFYYHANRRTGDGRWVEGETALFLTGVRGEGDAWVATASDGTLFSVNVDRLLIIHKDGREEEQRAT